MTLTDEQLADLEIILNDLVLAFYEAADEKRAMATLQSMIGSRFHQRVERLYEAVLTETTTQT